MNFVCDPCKDQSCEQCANLDDHGKPRDPDYPQTGGTWCDCQHRKPKP